MPAGKKRPNRTRKSDKLPPPPRPPREIPDDELFPRLTERILALTPEDMLDTSIEDKRTAENFRFASQLHAEALARGDKGAIELDRLAKQAEQELATRRLQVPETGLAIILLRTRFGSTRLS
jgi:hypothetical protein